MVKPVSITVDLTRDEAKALLQYLRVVQIREAQAAEAIDKLRLALVRKGIEVASMPRAWATAPKRGRK